MQKNQKVLVRAADGVERELVLLRIARQTAYVCAPDRYREAVENPDLGVGFPMSDVKLLSRRKPLTRIRKLNFVDDSMR